MHYKFLNIKKKYVSVGTDPLDAQILSRQTK